MDPIFVAKTKKPLNPYPRILEKKSKSREMSKRHSWKKNPAKIPKIAFWEMSKRHFWKKIQTFFLDIWSWIFKNFFFGKWVSVISGKKIQT